MLRILLVDDHAVVRQGLKQILEEEFSRLLFGEASNAAEALKQIREQDWDVVILDITLPDRNGLDLLEEIELEHSTLPVFVLSMHAEELYAVRVLRAGAAGYMTKESAPEELVEAIRKVLGGGKYVSPSLAERLAFELEKDAARLPHETLSNREYQVLLLIASGKTVTEIANQLHLSVKTISTYRARIMDKMGMITNAQLVHYAIKNRLVD